MTNSEKLISSFSEKYFYKELVYSDLKFNLHDGKGTEVELADLIINLEDIVLAIQLKERNEKDRTQDKSIEEKWLKNKCKKAKEQIKDTISYINKEKVAFVNARGKVTRINSDAEVVPLVVFENDSISEYEHLLRSHTDEGLTVNCISIKDFQFMCQELMSPMEIVEYIKWRKKFYESNGTINLMITETEKGSFYANLINMKPWYISICMRSMERNRYQKINSILNYSENMCLFYTNIQKKSQRWMAVTKLLNFWRIYIAMKSSVLQKG